MEDSKAGNGNSGTETTKVSGGDGGNYTMKRSFPMDGSSWKGKASDERGKELKENSEKVTG